MAAFAADSGVHQLTIREPQISVGAHFGLEPTIEGHGLAGLFPPDLTGFHDGAQVPVAIGLELLRGNASRWHRLTSDTMDAVRAGLTPRSLLTVWPDLSTDVVEILAALPDEGSIELVWEDERGQITSTIADETQFGELAARVAGARAATALSLYVDERHPLFTAVLPDSDGILRARWRTEPTPSDDNWALLKTLHRGQIINGTVSAITGFGVTFVDIGSFTAMINIPELSWRPVDHPSAILAVGEEITAQILDVDMVRERVTLSLEALQEDPMP
ncbi:S1 RNA-binding domain-containing protein [Nocardia jinanensis]|uniref:S1 RNA-binding domain-containing protein n=1 Tax=Nocardia jinanensis TaxID=382504 RepID=A0A917VMG4_9NOCA|nr:S1 RNA-binding domain-containing protein [Nocardia jinanensis]GGK98878.1 hypothetical protein GCM10011588_11850 [Nocardia jinanensis]